MEILHEHQLELGQTARLSRAPFLNQFIEWLPLQQLALPSGESHIKRRPKPRCNLAQCAWYPLATNPASCSSSKYISDRINMTLEK